MSTKRSLFSRYHDALPAWAHLIIPGLLVGLLLGIFSKYLPKHKSQNDAGKSEPAGEVCIFSRGSEILRLQRRSVTSIELRFDDNERASALIRIDRQGPVGVDERLHVGVSQLEGVEKQSAGIGGGHGAQDRHAGQSGNPDRKGNIP